MTDLSNENDLKAYYREAGSWAGDRLAHNSRSKKIAWIVAGTATFVAVLEAIALVGLMPLKTVVPMAVLVDRQTGYVTTVDPTKSVEIAPDTALTRSMLAQYVVARETIDRASVSNDYRKVVLWSDGTARTAYLAQMKPGSPANPYSHLPATAATQVAIRSVSTLDDGSAMVRFDLIEQGVAGAAATIRPYVSVMRYQYRRRNLTEADRLINPLGFAVSSYRRDAEAPPSTIASPAVTPAASAPALQAPATQP